jgi:tetratricopeptide (TPR) repeat protein
VLQLDANNLVAVESLVTLYEEANDAKRLAGVLAVQVEYSPDEATKKQRLLRLADLHARELRDAQGALRWQLAAFEADPLDVEVRAELERMATRTHSWPKLAERYEAVAMARKDVDRVALLGVVAREKETAGDVDGAMAAWQMLAAEEPPHGPALDALVRMYEGKEAWRELHDVYLKKLELVGHDREARRPIVVALAGLAERQGDDRRAVAAYRRLMHELGPDDATLAALEALHLRAGQLDEVEKVLVERLDLPDAGPRVPELTFRLGEVRQQRGKLSEAVALFGEVLQMQATHAGARAALEAIAHGDAHQIDAALLLEPILRASGDSVRLADILGIRIKHAEGIEAVALMHELASLQAGDLGQRDEAYATMARALKAEPSHQPTYEALEKMAAPKAEWDRVVALYREVATRPLSIPEHVEVRCRLGKLYRDRLHDDERALNTFKRVLDLQPDNDVAGRAIDSLLRSLGRPGELAERMHRQLLREPDAPDARRRWLELAQLYDEQLGDGKRAVAVYGDILSREEDASEAVAGLERLFAAGVERQAVAALLMPRYRRAGQLEDLVRVWSTVLVEAPDAQPIGELCELARQAEKTELLRGALAEAIARAEKATTRTSLRMALCAIERERGDEAAAEAALRAVLDDDPASVDVAVRIDIFVDLAERQVAAGKDRAARALYEEALVLGDDARALRALGRLAEADRAIDLWQRLCAVAPGDAEALSSLAALYERHEKWHELVEVLDRQIAEAQPDAVPALVEQQALVWTRLHEPTRAEATWRRLADLRPGATDPWRAIAKIMRAGERYRELVEVYERILEAEPTDVQTATQWAKLETETLERVGHAIEVWQRVLAADPKSDEALAALDALYARTGVAEARRHVLEKRAELALGAARADAAAIAVEAAHAADGDYDTAAAARWYDRVLEIAPDHAGALAYLQQYHRSLGDDEALIALLRRRADAVTGSERSELLAEVASVQENQLGNDVAAFATRLEAFESDASWVTHGESLKRLAPRAVDGWQRLAAALQRRAPKAQGAERTDLYLELGGVLEEAKQMPAAIAAYQALLKVDPAVLDALERLERIYRASGQAALLDVLEQHAEMARDREEQIRLYQALAEEAVRLERWARAVEAHRHAADLDRAGERRGAELYQAGLIYRDQLAEFDEALACFESATRCYGADGLDPPAELVEATAKARARRARSPGKN